MVRYPRCPRCETYNVHDKGECFYCGADLEPSKLAGLGMVIRSTLRLLKLDALSEESKGHALRSTPR